MYCTFNDIHNINYVHIGRSRLFGIRYVHKWSWVKGQILTTNILWRVAIAETYCWYDKLRNRDWKRAQFCTLIRAIHVGAHTQQWTTIVGFREYARRTTRQASRSQYRRGSSRLQQDCVRRICMQHRNSDVSRFTILLYTNTQRSLIVHRTHLKRTI